VICQPSFRFPLDVALCCVADGEQCSDLDEFNSYFHYVQCSSLQLMIKVELIMVLSFFHR